MTQNAGNAALVTGHSRGLGAASAAQLLSRGIPVLGVARTHNRDLAEHFGGLLQQVQLDFANVAAVERWLAGDRLRRFVEAVEVPLLVNNAGLLQPIGPLQTQHVDAVARAVVVNVAAPLMLSAAFVQVSSGARERRILHVSSGAGRKPYAGWSVYCATKAALDHHARAVVLDRTPGLRICSIAPGVIDTHMQAEIRASTEHEFPDRARFVAMQREGKLHRADDTARLLVDFLLSDQFGTEPVSNLR